MIPDPLSEIFAGWIFESLNFIQVMMVELFPKWLKGIAYLGIINQPSQLLIAFAADVECGFEAMSVESMAFMILGKARQRVCGFELKCFLEFDFHFTVPSLSR